MGATAPQVRPAGTSSAWHGFRTGLWQKVNFVRLTRDQQMDVINRTFHGAEHHA